VVGGFLGEIDIRLPFWVAAGMALLNFTYGLFVLPESLPPEKRTPFRIVNANPLGSLSLLRSDFVVFRLGLVHFLGNLGHFVLNSTFVLYAGYRYGWGEKMIGITLGLVGIFTALVQGVLVKHVVARIGAARALMIGAFVGSVGMLLYGLASTGPLFWIVMPIMAFWGLTGPSLQQLATSRIAATDQGKLQGALSALVGIAGMIGPVLFTSAFGWAIDPKSSIHIPGLAFYIASAIVFLSCLSAVSIWNHLRPREVSV
jgi:DHA1 family tetracycline resistance protein-like MFS transporter